MPFQERVEVVIALFPDPTDFQHASAHREPLKYMPAHFVQLCKNLETRNKNEQKQGGCFCMCIQNYISQVPIEQMCVN